jgi:putative oxidoreductase
MSVESQEIPSIRIDRVGHTGIYPMSGPMPPGDAPVRTAAALAHPEQRQLTSGTVPSSSVERTALMMGRAIFGGYFAYSGVNHFLNAEMMSAYARTKHVPFARAAVLGSGAMLLLGGLSLATGYRPKIGASLIAGFLAGVTPQMHDFWRMEDQQQRMHEFINFTKNVALIGGACFAAAQPEPWPASARV